MCWQGCSKGSGVVRRAAALLRALIVDGTTHGPSHSEQQAWWSTLSSVEGGVQRGAFTMQASSQSSRHCGCPRHKSPLMACASTMRYPWPPCKLPARRPLLAAPLQVQARTSTFSGQQLVTRRPFVARAARPSVAVVQAAGARLRRQAASAAWLLGCSSLPAVALVRFCSLTFSSLCGCFWDGMQTATCCTQR